MSDYTVLDSFLSSFWVDSSISKTDRDDNNLKASPQQSMPQDNAQDPSKSPHTRRPNTSQSSRSRKRDRSYIFITKLIPAPERPEPTEQEITTLSKIRYRKRKRKAPGMARSTKNSSNKAAKYQRRLDRERQTVDLSVPFEPLSARQVLSHMIAKMKLHYRDRYEAYLIRDEEELF